MTDTNASACTQETWQPGSPGAQFTNPTRGHFPFILGFPSLFHTRHASPRLCPLSQKTPLALLLFSFHFLKSYSFFKCHLWFNILPDIPFGLLNFSFISEFDSNYPLCHTTEHFTKHHLSLCLVVVYTLAVTTILEVGNLFRFSYSPSYTVRWEGHHVGIRHTYIQVPILCDLGQAS